MIACSGMALGIGLRAAIMAPGQSPRVIMAAQRSIPRTYHYRQPLTNLLITASRLKLDSLVNQAIMGFTRPLWILLGHYGSAIIGCASQVI